MCVLMGVLHFVMSLAVVSHLVSADDICLRCQCLPNGASPTQAICRNDGSTDKVFSPTTTENTASLELVYMYGIETVNFTENSFLTVRPVTLLVHNCSGVVLGNGAVPHLRTLAMRGVGRVVLGEGPESGRWQNLWAVVFEDIDQLIVSTHSLVANYSITISRAQALTLLPTDQHTFCNENSNFTFTLIGSKVKPVLKGGISLCGGSITINNNIFESVAEEGFQITSEESVAIINNRFEHLAKKAFNLSSPEIHITNNHFHNLPAGALRAVSTIHDTFFTNNTISDVDLGGVLLDMGWDMVIEHNIIECDCASKRTSILNPKQDMLYLSNSSLEKLQNIFLNNICNLNCTVTLKTFSYALMHGEVCVTNDTQLEEDLLCHVTFMPDSTVTTFTTSENEVPFMQSAANKIQNFLVPISIFVVTLFITSSVCYGCKEAHSFKFTFNPHRETSPKMSLQ